jgi:hypothetical protein
MIAPVTLLLEPLSRDEADAVLRIVEDSESVAPSEKSQSFRRLLASRSPKRRMTSSAPETLSEVAQLEAFRLTMIAVCLSGEPTDEAMRHLKSLNHSLPHPTPWVSIFDQARKGNTKRATMRMGLRSPDAKAMLPAVWRDGGVWGVFKAVAQAMGLGGENRELAERYRALADLDEASTGLAFYHHMRHRKLALPGEKGGIFERAIHHDMMHVITGFDTDARGEARLSAYYAGATSRHPIRGADPFTFILVGLMTFELGYNIGPSFVESKRGAVDPHEFFAILDLGHRAPVNILTDWDVRAALSLPLVDVRRTFGLSDLGVGSVRWLPSDGALTRDDR